jgi:hypothetical protein
MIVGEELLAGEDAFVEKPGRYLVELREPTLAGELRQRFTAAADVVEFGLVQHLRKLTVTSTKSRVEEISLDDLVKAWRATLDW